MSEGSTFNGLRPSHQTHPLKIKNISNIKAMGLSYKWMANNIQAVANVFHSICIHMHGKLAMTYYIFMRLSSLKSMLL